MVRLKFNFFQAFLLFVLTLRIKKQACATKLQVLMLARIQWYKKIWMERIRQSFTSCRSRCIWCRRSHQCHALSPGNFKLGWMLDIFVKNKTYLTSLPNPDSLTPPNAASTQLMRLSFTPTIPTSRRLATLQHWLHLNIKLVFTFWQLDNSKSEHLSRLTSHSLSKSNQPGLP